MTETPIPTTSQERIQPGYGKTHVTALKLAVERIQLRWDDSTGQYLPRDEIEPDDTSKTPEKTFALSLVRKFYHFPKDNSHFVTEEIHLHSDILIEVVKDIMKGREDIGWDAKPLKFSPNILLAYMERFKLRLLKLTTEEREMTWNDAAANVVNHFEFFVEFLSKEYREELQELQSLLSANQITFERLWGVFLPGTILFTRTSSGDPSAVRMVSMAFAEANTHEPERQELTCEHSDIFEGMCGLADLTIKIPRFDGAKLLTDLAAYPLNSTVLKEPEYTKSIRALHERGQRYWNILGGKQWCHMSYSGVAFREDREGNRKVLIKSRIILDRAMYDSYSSSQSPPPKWNPNDLHVDQTNPKIPRVLTEHDLMLMSPTTYGYSLDNGSWLVFRIDAIQDVVWNPNLFDQLELQETKKNMIRTLVESHHSDLNSFDDFVIGKGAGLVFNLHGPPGVGKTLTAEATSEITKSPLFIMGCSDLGGRARELDNSITRAFEIALRWKAIILIDEADVFLEKRDVRDVKRNAMVAVLLRQLEYHPGIVFLTTNRVGVFDEAMKSRIHVSLFYDQLSPQAKGQLWVKFLKKTTLREPLTTGQLDYLQRLKLNGREIKNVVKVASTLVAHDGRPMDYEDIKRAVNTLNQGPEVALIQEKSLRPFHRISLPSYHTLGMIVLVTAAVTKYCLHYHISR